MKIEPKLYSIDDACKVLGGISRTTIYKLVKSNDISIVKIYRRAFIDAKSIDNLIAKNTENQSESELSQ